MQDPDDSPWADGFVTFCSFIFFGMFPLLAYACTIGMNLEVTSTTQLNAILNFKELLITSLSIRIGLKRPVVRSCCELTSCLLISHLLSPCFSKWYAAGQNSVWYLMWPHSHYAVRARRNQIALHESGLVEIRTGNYCSWVCAQ